MNYTGNELELFAHALQWKRYWSSLVRPYIKGDVLEVGSGLGANIPFLYRKNIRSWSALEPDRSLLESGREKVIELPVKFVHGDLGVIERAPRFDTILYIDVLEHIEQDRVELIEATARLRPGGHLIILVPAFMLLYSRYDTAIGHFRRYTRPSLRQVIPSVLREERLKYLDAFGLPLSLLNRILLDQTGPTIRQVLFWDRFIVPLSRIVDPAVGHSFGRSLLGVWTLQ
jgi:SAM-dependent methyltransferase